MKALYGQAVPTCLSPIEHLPALRTYIRITAAGPVLLIFPEKIQKKKSKLGLGLSSAALSSLSATLALTSRCVVRIPTAANDFHTTWVHAAAALIILARFFSRQLTYFLLSHRVGPSMHSADTLTRDQGGTKCLGKITRAARGQAGEGWLAI